MASQEPATILKYGHSLFKGIGRILSGSLTVIPGYAGQYVWPAYGQVIWIGTALAAVVIWSYQAWAEEYNKRVALEEAALPKIEILDLYQHPIPSSSPMTRVYDLVIKNSGGQPLDCIVKVISVNNVDIEPKILQAIGHVSGNFSLNPDEKKRVEFCSRKVMYSPPTKTRMVLGETIGYDIDSPIVFGIGVYSSAGATYAKYEVSVDVDNALAVKRLDG